MATPSSLTLTQDQLSELTHLSTLLHLFHHRNKNQHRHSIWYRHFSTLRSQLQKLILDQQKLLEVPTTNLARAQKKTLDAQLASTTTARLEFWRDVMVPKWQHSFSQLIADGRFSVLGLVLMSVLAGVCGIVEITAELEDLGQMEVEKVLEEFGREEWGGSGEDLGELIRRDDEVPAKVTTPVVEVQSLKRDKVERKVPSTSTKRKPASDSKPPKKKRKKTTGNAIDDIFG